MFLILSCTHIVHHFIWNKCSKCCKTRLNCDHCNFCVNSNIQSFGYSKFSWKFTRQSMYMWVCPLVSRIHLVANKISFRIWISRKFLHPKLKGFKVIQEHIEQHLLVLLKYTNTSTNCCNGNENTSKSQSEQWVPSHKVEVLDNKNGPCYRLKYRQKKFYLLMFCLNSLIKSTCCITNSYINLILHKYFLPTRAST